MDKFKGIFPALLTPFDENDKINTEALGQMVEMNIKKGVKGFYVDGSTAEAFLLTHEERKYILSAVKEAANGRVTLIAHVGCIGTNNAIDLAKHAKSLGYDAMSSVAPFYYKFSFGEIKKYYYDIVNAVELPMLVYNFPAFSGVTLTADNINEFLCDDRFMGVKHTSSDYFAMERFKKLHPDKIIYNGYDETFLAGLAMGADGAIGSTFNFMAEKFIKIQSLFNENKLSEAQAIQHDADTIIAALCKVGVMQGEKAMLNHLGIPCGKCRAPFGEMSKADEKYLIDIVEPLL